MEDVFKLFYDSDVGIFCFHSDAKNLEYGAYRSNKLFEYMCTNLAIIVSNIGNWPEIVNGHNCGITVKPEVSNIRDGITFLYNHPSKRESLGKNGRTTALSKFTWESQEESLIQFYEDITNKS
jgi:glycosyltransferase involved in cell wall biosynthesis